ncbi:STAS domain-containing protein [Streptomyces sp. NRRL B-24085]|uniref:STAS domain-containing protein n=2 Tax=Streptomyces sp. NRRL B-24085 TaxID=1709476 RepID=UPI000A39D712|nr:STAS domain-containing protein [Streptomyces sp. NRRL B-24085]
MTAEPSVQANASGTSLTVQVGGEMDWQTAAFLRERLLGEITAGQRCVVLDLSAVSFCDSAGLNVLLWAWRRAGQAGSVLVLAGVQQKVQRTLEMAGADTVLRVYRTVGEAENALDADGA